jgi:hypothetical protein
MAVASREWLSAGCATSRHAVSHSAPRRALAARQRNEGPDQVPDLVLFVDAARGPVRIGDVVVCGRAEYVCRAGEMH